MDSLDGKEKALCIPRRVSSTVTHSSVFCCANTHPTHTATCLYTLPAHMRGKHSGDTMPAACSEDL